MAPKGDFVRLFLPLQGDLLAYILALGVPAADADDVLQESASVMLAKMDRFEEGTNFRSWAFTVVKLEVRKALAARARRPLSLPEEIYEDLGALAMSETELPTLRFKALTVCLEKLQDRARELIRLRYREGMAAAAIADALQRPVEAVYTSLSRIRKMLHECIARVERAEEHPA